MQTVKHSKDVVDGDVALKRVSVSGSHCMAYLTIAFQVIGCLWQRRNLLFQIETLPSLLNVIRPCKVKTIYAAIWNAMIDQVAVVEDYDMEVEDEKTSKQCPAWMKKAYPNSQKADTERKQVLVDMAAEADNAVVTCPNVVAFRMLRSGHPFWRTIHRQSRNRDFNAMSTMAMVTAAAVAAYRPKVLKEGGALLCQVLEAALDGVSVTINKFVGKGKMAAQRQWSWWDGLDTKTDLLERTDIVTLADEVKRWAALAESRKIISGIVSQIERNKVAVLNPGAKPADRLVASEVSAAVDELFKVRTLMIYWQDGK